MEIFHLSTKIRGDRQNVSKYPVIIRRNIETVSQIILKRKLLLLHLVTIAPQIAQPIILTFHPVKIPKPSDRKSSIDSPQPPIGIRDIARPISASHVPTKLTHFVYFTSLRSEPAMDNRDRKDFEQVPGLTIAPIKGSDDRL